MKKPHVSVEQPSEFIDDSKLATLDPVPLGTNGVLMGLI